MSAPRIVIAGAGQAGFQLACSVRERSSAATITVVGAEPELPYQRPPLSKEILAGAAGERRATLRKAHFYGAHRIDLITGDPAESIDRAERRMVLRSGRTLLYDRVVLATGSEPKVLPIEGATLNGAQTLRTLTDALALRDRLGPGVRLAIVGAGAIGLEVAAAARARGVRVTVLEAGRRVMARMVSEPVSEWLTDAHRRAGVEIVLGCGVERIVGSREGHVLGVELSDGTRLASDAVLIAVGVAPVTRLAAQSRLEVDDGVVVDRALRTEDPAIWAIGDCARFRLRDGRHVRLESIQNATDQAHCVAAALTGDPESYDEVPWFWSDQLGSRVQIAGLAAPGDEQEVRQISANMLSVWRYRAGRLTAVESINEPRVHLAARRMLVERDDDGPSERHERASVALLGPAGLVARQ